MSKRVSKKYCSVFMFCCMQNYGASEAVQRAERIGVACCKGRLGIHRERSDGEYVCAIAYSPDEYIDNEQLQHVARDLCSLVKEGEQKASTLAEQVLCPSKRNFFLSNEERTELILEIYRMQEQQTPTKLQSLLIHITGLYVTSKATVFSGFSEARSSIFVSEREPYIGKVVHESFSGLKKDPIAVSISRTEDTGVDRLAGRMFDVHSALNRVGYVVVIASPAAAQQPKVKCSVS